MTKLISPDRLGSYFAPPYFTTSAFRLETLTAYAVDSDGDDYQRWLDGAPGPDPARKQAWLDTLQRDRNAGRRNYRVKIMSAERSLYERYACEWGYAYNAPLDEVRILDLAETPLPPELYTMRDFWLIDDAYVIVMHYDHTGRFQGGELPPSTDLIGYLRAREAAMNASVPFREWWVRHPELRRDVKAA